MAARGRNVLLRLTGDSGDAKRAVNEVRSDLRRMSREEATVRLDVQTARVERQIEAVKQKLETLSHKTSTPRVELQTVRAREQLALLEIRLDRLKLKKVNIDVDVKRGGIERTAAALGSIDRGIDKVVTGFGDALRAIPVFGQVFATVLNGIVGLGNAIGSAVTGMLTSLTETTGILGKFASLAGPIGSVVGTVVNLAAGFAALAALGGALVIALNAILGAVVALGGALVALVASLTAAVAGLGALAAAFGVALIPIVIVAVGLFTRFAAILKARQAQQQQLAQATQQQKTAEQAVTDALAQRRTAEQQLAEAVVEGRKAMAKAAVDEKDAELSLESSRLGVREARLNLAQARKDLKDFLKEQGAAGPTLNSIVKKFSNVDFDPSKAGQVLGAVGANKPKDPLELQQKILAVQRAQLGVKESINQTTHAESNLAEATKRRADFARRGLEAYKPYRQALERVRQAEIRLTRAQNQSSAAQRKYQEALKGLSGTEKTTLSNLDKFLAAFKNLAKAFTDPVFKALNDVFDSLSGKSSFLKDSLTLVGRAMGDVVRAFGRFLGEPRTIEAFKIMARGAADLIRQLGARALVNGFRILREIAVTALPALRDMARDVAKWMGNIAAQPAKIHNATRGVVDQFRTWLRLAGSVLGLVKDIFVPASKQGKNLADSMRHVVDHWREWIRENPKRVAEFFRTSVRRTKEIVTWLAHAASWLKNNLPKAAATAESAFHKVASVLSGIYHTMKVIVDLARGDFRSAIHDITHPNAKHLLEGAAKQIGNVALGPSIIPRKIIHELTHPAKSLSDTLKQKQRENDQRSPDAGLGRRATASAAPPRGPAIGNVTITVPGGGSPDPRTLAAKLERELRLAG